MEEGVELVGEHTYPPNFPKDWRPASISREDLLESAPWRRQVLIDDACDVESQRDADLKEATLEEVGLGFLQGPFTEQQITDMFRGEKWYFKLELMDMDSFACVMTMIARALVEGQVCAETASEGSIGGRVSRIAAQGAWQGRTLDLSKAYNQVPLAPESRQFCIIGHRIENEWSFFTTNVLPFGAVASVHAFNGISRAIHHILSTFLSAICAVFYDGFPTLSSKAGASLLSKSMSHVLNNLGWTREQIGTKAIDFFNASGVKICLERLPSGQFTLANKQGRIEKVVGMLEKIIQDGSVTRKGAAEIQGLLNFVSGFYLSKALKFLLGAFDKLADSPSSQTGKNLRTLCNTAISLLKNLPPRVFDARQLRHTHLLFTDGGVAKAGAVFFNGLTGQGWVAEILAPETLIQHWLEQVGSQVICQVGYYAFLVLRYPVANEIKNQQAIAWIDNEAARAAAVKRKL